MWSRCDSRPLLTAMVPAKRGSKPRVIPFEVKMLFCVFVLLSYPAALCLMLYNHRSVRYWCGDWQLPFLAAVAVAVLFSYFISTLGYMRKNLAVVLMLIVPSALLAVGCELLLLSVRWTSAELNAHDCSATPSKARLQTAWLEAYDLHSACLQHLTNVTGASLQQEWLVTPLQSCQGYASRWPEFGAQWSYLQEMEEKYHCGGWCEPARPMWYTSPLPQDSCSVAVGRALAGGVATTTKQVSTYALIVTLGVSLILLLVPKWLQLDDAAATLGM